MQGLSSTVDSPAAEQAAQRPRPAFVYLVHGTWGRGIRPGKTLLGRPRTEPAWSESGSLFYTELQRHLSACGWDPTLCSFNWSGSNAVMDRDAEAKRLGKQLDEDAARHPDWLQLIVSHSHGGNIALEAARHYRRTLNELHIVTLATPFIDLWLPLHQSAATDDLTELGRASVKRFGLSRFRRLVVAFVLTLVSFWCGYRIGWVPPFSAIVGQFASSWGLGFLAAWAILDIAVNLLLTGTGTGDDKLMRVPRLGAQSVPGLALSRMLVLRGTDDEAGLALAAGSVQALLGSGVWRATLPLLALLNFLPAIFAFFANDWPGAQSLQVFMLRALSVFLIGSLLEALGRATAGREFFLKGGLLRISVNSAPDFTGDMTVRTLAAAPPPLLHLEPKPFSAPLTPRLAAAERIPGGRFWSRLRVSFQLKHSLYSHPDCVAAIVRWLPA